MTPVGSGELLTSVAPADGAVLGSVAMTPRDEVSRVVARAKRAQAAWALVPVRERCERLLRLRDALVDAADDLATRIGRETGKPRVEALTHEVGLTLDLLSYACGRAERDLAPREIGLHLFRHKRSVVHYVPCGVVGVISPWNFPFVIPMATVVAALVAGNAVVVKPSEFASLTMHRAKQLFDGTGLPEDLFSVVFGRGDIGEALVRGGVRKIVFTGGVATGRRVAAACGEALVPCVLELGGKAPLIACADCDVERTARAIVFGGFVNAGQACVAVERVYAHADVHDRLLARARELTLELRVGDPSTSHDVDVGAVTTKAQLARARELVADAVARGAAVVVGGAERGAFFEPTLLERCDGTMRVMTEESFAPIVPFQKVSSDEEALRLANDSALGLSAYVFGRDRARAASIAARLEAGSVVVNDVVSQYAVAEAPFGGVKESGFGRVHGEDALRDMSEVRHVLTSRFFDPPREPHWFPYSARAYRASLGAVRAWFTRGGLVRRLRALL